MRAMISALRHRGPDAEGLIAIPVGGGSVVLGHTRLSILDLSDGSRQPIEDAETGSWLVYNGEIYNFRELRRELEGLGARFHTTGDTEVLLRALVVWGESALTKLEGMFAFAFWDGQTKMLLLARDAMGIKPVYYRRVGVGVELDQQQDQVQHQDQHQERRTGVSAPHELFAFASEVRALERAGIGPLTVDEEAVDSFLAYGAVIGPKTIWKEIREVGPGCLLRVDGRGAVWEGMWWSARPGPVKQVRYDWDGRPEAQRYLGANGDSAYTGYDCVGRPAALRGIWPAGTESVQGVGYLAPGMAEFASLGDFETAVGVIRERLEKAVGAHLVSDVPVGVFLSGGVDSSLIALVAARESAIPITLLTVDFAEQEFSELPHARRIAGKIPHRHEVVTLSAADLRELLPEALAAMDQPTVDGINTFVISRVGAKCGLKVLLTGIGGDELFGGYSTFRNGPRLLAYAKRFGAGLRSAAGLMAKVSGSPIPWKKVAEAGEIRTLADAYLLQRSVRWRGGKRRALAERLEQNVAAMENDFQRIAGMELTFYMRYQLLRDADVFSMASSVELRVPFLDLDLVEAALGMRPEFHFAGRGAGKRLTKRILNDLMGEELPERKKMGFTFPWRKWLREGLRETIAGTLRDESLYAALGLDAAYGRELLEGLEKDDKEQSWSEVWSLFVLLNWAGGRQKSEVRRQKFAAS